MSLYEKNFATKILELLNQRDEIKVVYDQISSPTTTIPIKVIWETIKLNDIYTKERKLFRKLCTFLILG